MTTPLLHFGRYREIAADVAARLASGAEGAIVASGGMGAAILLQALRSAPRGAVSLDLPTIDAFARAIVNDAGAYPRVASDAEQRFAMQSAARLAAERIIDSDALGAMLQRSYRDLRDSGMTVDDFESRTGSTRNRRRAEAMVRAWREYERLIALTGGVDPADVLLQAESLIGGAHLKPQVIAGFYDMTGLQLRIVHALGRAGRLAAIYVPAAESNAFVSRFVSQLPPTTLGDRAPALQINQPQATIAQYENKFVEMREICRSVASRIAAGARPAEIGIVARSFDPYDLRLAHRFAEEFGFSVAAAEAMPLVAHRIGRAIVTLLRLRDRNFPRSAVLDLLRDGLQTSRQLNLDRVDDATRKARIAGGTGDAIRAIPDYAGAVAEIDALAPSNALAGADWAALLHRIIGLFRVETDADAGATAAIGDIASLLTRAHAWNRRFQPDAVVDLLEQTMLPVSKPAPPSSVWMGDIMRFRGRAFEHLFVARMQDDIFPQRRTDDPLLPDIDRRAIGLSEIGDGLEEERLLFSLLHDGARASIEFTLAGSDGLGKLLRPSPLLKQFAVERHPDARAAILRDFGKSFARRAASEPRTGHAIVTRQLQRVALAGTRSMFDGVLPLSERVRERIDNALQSLSPTALEDFGECPQKFLWKHILGIRDLDEPELELHVNARDKGKLDHTILERFYRSLTEQDITTSTALKPELRERLDALVDAEFDAFEERFPPFNPAMRAIERRATKRHLQRFVVSDLSDLDATGLRPAHFEYAFGPRFDDAAAHREPFTIVANGVPINIQGRIDRIDQGPDRLRVIDYKSGKAMRHQELAKKIDRGVRMQLALYAMTVAAFFGRDESSVSGAIKPLRGGKESKFSFDLGTHAARLRETLDLFTAAIIEARFPAFPNDKDDQFDSCSYCPVNHSCRTRHDDAERYAVTRFEDPRTLLSQ